MRFFILISLLCSIAFSALYLNGATYTQIVTINHLQVAETNSDFLFQLKIPRVGALLTAVESADDVAFTNVNDTTRRARWVVYTPDTIFMYSHIAVSSTVDTSYRLQYGKALNEVNSSSTFTNCGITNFWGMDNTSTPISNYAGGPTLTASGSWSSNTGMFDVAVLSTVSTDMLTSDISIFANKTAFTYTILFRPGTIAGDNIFFSYRTSAGNIGFQIYYNPTIMNVYIGGVGNYGQIANPLVSNTPCLVSIVYDGTQSTNATRLKLFVNNEQKTFGGFNGTIPASIPSISGAETGNGISGISTASPVGLIDDQCVAGAATTLGCISDRYNMLFTPSTFSTLGTPLATTSITGSRRSGYRQINMGQGMH
jgi:hypothetical protein